MATRYGIHAELSSLREELGRRSGSTGEGPSDGAATASPERADAPADAAGLEEQLRELGKVLSEFTDSAEETIMDHPIPAVLAAFVLGIAVGRLLGRA